MVTPNSKAIILQGVPFANNYQDLLTFSSSSAQYSYFAGLAKFAPIDELSYLKSEEGFALSIELAADELRDCNYVMYQNTDYSSKWFFAFITHVDYVNDGLSRVFMVEDVWQTWQFDINFKSGFVAREHVNDDTIGANLLPEGLETGELKHVLTVNGGIGNTVKILVAATVDASGADTVGNMYAGIYSGACFYAYDTAAEVNAFITALQTHGKADAIIGMCMIPAFIVDVDANNKVIPRTAVNVTTVSAPPRPIDFDGYVPKNNKLFTSPYVNLLVNAPSGSSAAFNYENFFGQPLIFSVLGDVSLTPTIMCRPASYNGASDTTPYGVMLGGYPSCTWSSSAFANWYGGHPISWQLGIINSAMPSNVAAAASSPLAAAGELGASAYNVFSNVAAMYEHSLVPPQAKGSTGASALLLAAKVKDFYLSSMAIKKDYAVTIDNFFSKFGYKVNKLKAPNIYGRQCWNYVKMVDAIVGGGCPADVARMMEQILNNGVTFWHTSDIGNYDAVNNIV